MSCTLRFASSPSSPNNGEGNSIYRVIRNLLDEFNEEQVMYINNDGVETEPLLPLYKRRKLYHASASAATSFVISLSSGNGSDSFADCDASEEEVDEGYPEWDEDGLYDAYDGQVETLSMPIFPVISGVVENIETVYDDDISSSNQLADLFEQYEQHEQSISPSPSIEVTVEPTKKLDECITKPLFAIPCNAHIDECPICYESIDMVNITITTCGHVFHSYCMFKSLAKSTCCPLCRHPLIEEDEDEDDEDAEDDNREDDEDAEDDNREDDEDADEYEDYTSVVSLSVLSTKLTNLGYTFKDIIRSIIGDIKLDPQKHTEDIMRENEAEDEKYTREYMYNFGSTVQAIMNGSITLSHRDTRSYRDVVAVTNV